MKDTKHMTIDDLSQNKCYVIFNHVSFYIHGGEKLKSLTHNKDIPLTLPQLQKCIQTEKECIQTGGIYFVAECDDINAALDFYNSELWRNFKL